MIAATAVCMSLLVAVPDKETAPMSNSWVGKIVIVAGTDQGIGQLNAQGELVPPLTPLGGLDYRVYGERGNYVQLKNREAVLGWVAKKDVVLLEEAVGFFTKQVEANPDDTAALNRRGWAWALRGEHLAGIKDLTECIRLSPDTTFYNNRARIWGLKGDHDRALADYTTGIDMGANYFLPFFNRGNCWHLKKEYDKAIADFNQALQLNGNFVAAYRSRGAAYLEKNDHEKALTDFDEAIRRDAKHDPAYLSRGDAWRTKKEYGKAKSDYEEARRLDPKNALYIQAQARLLATAVDAKFRDGKRAVELALEARELDRSSGLIMDTLAAAHAEAGNFEAAVHWQQRALDDPRLKDDADARRRLELYRKKQPYRQD